MKQDTITLSEQSTHSFQTKTAGEQKNLYDCAICKDTSWIISFDGKATRCKCFDVESFKETFRTSGLKTEDIEKTFKTFEHWTKDTKEMKSIATNYFLRFEQNKNAKFNSILFAGQSGAGKTHLSIALANNLLQKGYKVVYMQYRETLTSLKQSMLDKEYYNNIISKYQKCDVLLIDDLFKGKVNESDINIIFEIVNYRYINKKPMIISTQYKIQQMLDFDEAIGSRIFEMAKDFTYEILGKNNNYRLR